MTEKAWKQTDGKRETSKCLNKRGEEKYISDNIEFKSKILNRTKRDFNIIKYYTPSRWVFTLLVTKLPTTQNKTCWWCKEKLINPQS